ncbi:MAG TPA: hypothetical protein VHZ32_16925 [Rhizomicrobium sp.]|nr:hypothetical protein [Rhizomicrobium sp.]
MTALDKIGPAPETRSTHFLWLLFGASAAPLFWLGQTILAYGVTAHACFPGRYPRAAEPSPLFAAIMLFDVVAVIAAGAGGFVAFQAWRQEARPITSRQKRDHFLAVWGDFSSLCFLLAILFNVVASLTVSPCLM